MSCYNISTCSFLYHRKYFCLVGAISKQVNGQSHHQIAVTSNNAKKEEENLDSYFTEFQQTKQLSVSSKSNNVIILDVNLT